MGKFAEKLKETYDISMQCIERPGDELTFLKCLHVLQADGRLTVQTHQKHILQFCALLGLNVKSQNKKNPCHADVDHEDSSPELSPSAATVFRTCTGILMYLASDVPHAQYTIRYLSTYSSRPTEKACQCSSTLLGILQATVKSQSR